MEFNHFRDVDRGVEIQTNYLLKSLDEARKCLVKLFMLQSLIMINHIIKLKSHSDHCKISMRVLN